MLHRLKFFKVMGIFIVPTYASSDVMPFTTNTCMCFYTCFQTIAVRWIFKCH